MKKYVLIEKYKERKCTKCNDSFPATLDFFNKDRKNLKSFCKKCQKNKDKIYRDINPERKKEYNKINSERDKKQRKVRYEINKEIEKENNKKWRENNKEYVKNQQKIWRQNNPEYSKKHGKIYRNNNRKKINEYTKEKRKNDPLFKLSVNIRASIKMSIKRQGFSKKSKTPEILGCTYEEFKIHIENQFLPWMNWNNHGLYNGELYFGWDLDHIIPVASAQTEEELIKLNHYTNFQPLCSHINRNIKKDKINFVLPSLILADQ